MIMILGIFSTQKQSLLIRHIFIEMVLGCKWTIHFCTKCLDIRLLSCCWCKSITRCWLDFFDITSSPVYRFSKYQTETIGAFSLLFVVVAINDREINPSISFKLQGPESITCHSDFIISVWIDRTDLFPTISSCSMPERWRRYPISHKTSRFASYRHIKLD